MPEHLVDTGVPERPVDTGPQGFKVEFQLNDGKRHAVTFVRRPLGLDFNKTNPILMKRVQPGTHGEELGIQPGWRVVAVNDEDVVSREFDYTYNMLKRLSEELPNA